MTNNSEFLFIDANIADKQTLIDSAASNIKVVKLDTKTDALSHIVAPLKQQKISATQQHTFKQQFK